MSKYSKIINRFFLQHKVLLVTCISAILLLSFSCSQKKDFQPAGEQTKFDLAAKWDTVRVLENPHKGWYHHYYDNGHINYKGNSEAIEAMPGLDILFIRMAWSYFEPTEGNYDWHYIDDLVNEYAGKGLRFGFAFTCF